MTWQRARQPEQKEQRRADLLAAAAQLFDLQGYESVSLSAIAKQAGISKSNVYRYFDTKEEIFLQLMRSDLFDWVQAMERALAPLADRNDGDAVAEVLGRGITDHPRLTALIAVAASVLERNVTLEAVLEFKSSTMEAMIRLVNAIRAALPGLSMEQARQALSTFYLLVAGMWPAAHPSPVLQEVLARPEFEPMCVDYEQDIRSALTYLLRGMLASND